MTTDPLTPAPLPPRQVGGNTTMSASFDVMVSSMAALNSSIRQLSQDIQRSFDAQNNYTPGGMPGASQARSRVGRTQVDPQAGQTTQRNVRRVSLTRSAQDFASRVFGGRPQRPDDLPLERPLRREDEPLIPPADPMAGYTLGPQAPLPQTGGGGGGPQGPSGPSGGGGGGGGGQGGSGGSGGGSGGGGGGGGGGRGGRGGGGGQQQGGGFFTGPGMNPAAAGGTGGWSNMLLGQARRIPVVGTAMGVISSVDNLYLSEREKNRLYQGMEGGSNFAGFGERFHEEAYRWSMPGMSGQMARQSFKGVTSLGYTGKSQTAQGRQDALDFVYHNYNARGMDVNESLGMLQTASHDATVQFGELSDALKEVSDTAGKAGVNAKFMRQSFQGMLSAAIGTGAGPGSPDLAGIFSSTQASYGKQFQGMNFQGQLDRSYQYMIGAQYGVSPGQLQGIMRNQPNEYARMVTGSQMGMIQNFFSPSQIQELKNLIGQYGTSEQAVTQIEQEFLNDHPEIDLNVLADTLSQGLTGVQLDNSNVMDWVIQQLAGNTAAAHPAKGQGEKPVGTKSTGGARTGKYGLKSGDDWKKDLNNKAGFIGGVNLFGFGARRKSEPAQQYLKSVDKTKKRDPVLEAILQNVKDPNNTKVKVSTATGDRVVSLEDAMKLFPNELATGKVTIATGDQAGKTIADVVGGNVDTGRDTRSELTNKAGQKAGQSLSDYEKKHGKVKGDTNPAATQHVTVDLTTEAKQLLQLLPSTNSQSSATGYPPYNQYPSQASRP